jgi:predicted metal-binding membrane protein
MSLMSEVSASTALFCNGCWLVMLLLAAGLVLTLALILLLAVLVLLIIAAAGKLQLIEEED